MLRYLSTDIICSEMQTVFQEHSSRKTVSFEEQIMSKDKYASIFSKSNGGYCILQIFFATCAVLKIGKYSRIFPSFSLGIFSHLTRLDQSRASKIFDGLQGWIFRMALIFCAYLCMQLNLLLSFFHGKDIYTKTCSHDCNLKVIIKKNLYM